MPKLILKSVVVLVFQGVMAWFFYRCRAISHAFWAGSDFVVLFLPLLVGFAVVARILFFSFHRERIAVAFGLAGVGAAAASLAGLAVAFNLYGT